MYALSSKVNNTPYLAMEIGLRYDLSANGTFKNAQPSTKN